MQHEVKNTSKKLFAVFEKVITEITKGYDNQGVLNLPKRKVMLNLTGGVRNNEVPNFVLTQCDLPEGLSHRGGVFVRFDLYDESGSQENRVLVFFSELQKRFLLKYTPWTIDGTFKSVPSHFYHLVTVHGEFFGKFFLLCFILVSSKNKEITQLTLKN
ncbi:hypothetical protein CDIK_3469 [Cucumispora dikerogammari]|nr:hypothetical protein CDIK_3469 [Cucumispora dikerogammari]